MESNIECDSVDTISDCVLASQQIVTVTIPKGTTLYRADRFNGSIVDTTWFSSWEQATRYAIRYGMEKEKKQFGNKPTMIHPVDLNTRIRYYNKYTYKFVVSKDVILVDMNSIGNRKLIRSKLNQEDRNAFDIFFSLKAVKHDRFANTVFFTNPFKAIKAESLLPMCNSNITYKTDSICDGAYLYKQDIGKKDASGRKENDIYISRRLLTAICSKFPDVNGWIHIGGIYPNNDFFQDEIALCNARGLVVPVKLSKPEIIKGFTLLSFNVEYFQQVGMSKEGFKRISDFIKDVNADVVCIQEDVTSHNWEYLSNNSDYAFVSSCRGGKFKNSNIHLRNSILLKVDKFTNFRSNAISMKNFRCSCQVEFGSHIYGLGIKIANVHLTGGRFDDKNYMNLVTKKKEELDEIILDYHPDIVVGDFNYNPFISKDDTEKLWNSINPELNVKNKDKFLDYYFRDAHSHLIKNQYSPLFIPHPTSKFGGTPDAFYLKLNSGVRATFEKIYDTIAMKLSDHNAVLYKIWTDIDSERATQDVVDQPKTGSSGYLYDYE